MGMIYVGILDPESAEGLPALFAVSAGLTVYPSGFTCKTQK